MIRCYIGIGSNLNDPLAQVKNAMLALQNIPDSIRIAASSLYRTPPLGPIVQPDFINAVVALDTALPPLLLLQHLQRIEQQQGRIRDVRWGPRTLDLDFLLFGNQTINTPELCIPHPGLKYRDFVLLPLAEIAPNLVLPDGNPISHLLQCLSDKTSENSG